MSPTLPLTPLPRLTSLDAYRGFIMLAMASGGPRLAALVKQPEFADSRPWRALAEQLDHVTWAGCVFWDLIQPSFMFMVGVALPYSAAARRARGDSEGRLFGHVLLRSFVLVVLGVFLSSNGSKSTNYTFVNVLTQIGLGYPFLYLLANRGRVVQLAAAAVI